MIDISVGSAAGDDELMNISAGGTYVKCQIVSAPQSVVMTFHPYKNHLWKAEEGMIQMS